MKRTRHRLVLLAAIACLCFAPLGMAEPSSRDSEEARIEPSDNLCMGGLEDGKIIVTEPYLENPYRQTTRLGCEVDGGSPVTMPDLPAPDAAKTRLA